MFEENPTSSLEYLPAVETPDERKELIQRIKNTLHLIENSKDDFEIVNRSCWDNVIYDPERKMLLPKIGSDGTFLKQKVSGVRLIKMSIVLKRILDLLSRNHYATVRHLFYADQKFYGKTQSDLDSLIKDISCNLMVPRIHLHIKAAAKGLIFGDVEVTTADGHVFSYYNPQLNETLISSDLRQITGMKSNAKFLLIIEKEASFQSLLKTGKLCERFNCILMTGKGFPDVNTRYLSRLIWFFLKIPIFILTDGDPHGIDIYLQYKYGSLSMAYDALNLTTPTAYWMGIRPSDFYHHPFSPLSYERLNSTDLIQIKDLLERPYLKYDPVVRRELKVLRNDARKLGLQALDTLHPNYMSSQFIPHKLYKGDFIPQ